MGLSLLEKKTNDDRFHLIIWMIYEKHSKEKRKTVIPPCCHSWHKNHAKLCRIFTKKVLWLFTNKGIVNYFALSFHAICCTINGSDCYHDFQNIYIVVQNVVFQIKTCDEMIFIYYLPPIYYPLVENHKICFLWIHLSRDSTIGRTTV